MRSLVTHYHDNLQQRDENERTSTIESSGSNAPPCFKPCSSPSPRIFFGFSRVGACFLTFQNTCLGSMNMLMTSIYILPYMHKRELFFHMDQTFENYLLHVVS